MLYRVECVVCDKIVIDYKYTKCWSGQLNNTDCNKCGG